MNARASSRATGTEPSVICTLHFLQVPCPPHVESIARPFQLAASKTVTPDGTRADSPDGENLSSTRPVPDWVAWVSGGSMSPSRRYWLAENSRGVPSRPVLIRGPRRGPSRASAGLGWS